MYNLLMKTTVQQDIDSGIPIDMPDTLAEFHLSSHDSAQQEEQDRRKATLLAAVHAPHQGTSYNPPADAHQELLLKAHEEEERKLTEENKFADVKERMAKARIDEEIDRWGWCEEW